MAVTESTRRRSVIPRDSGHLVHVIAVGVGAQRRRTWALLLVVCVRGQGDDVFSHGFYVEVEPKSAVHNPVEDSVGDSGFTDVVVQFLDWELASDKG